MGGISADVHRLDLLGTVYLFHARILSPHEHILSRITPALFRLLCVCRLVVRRIAASLSSLLHLGEDASSEVVAPMSPAELSLAWR